MSKFRNFHDVPVLSLNDLVAQGDIELGRGNIISKVDIKGCPGLFPIYSSSSKNNGMMGSYGHYMFDEEMVTWSVDGGGTFFYRPKHKFSVTNVSGYMRANQVRFDYRFLHAVLDYQHSFLNFDYQSKAHPSVIREIYEIPIPALREQKKIASILTSVDEVIETTQQQIEKLQDLKRGTINELLTKGIGNTEFKASEVGKIPKTWEVKKLQDCCELITNGFVGATRGIYEENGVPYLLCQNVRPNHFVDEVFKYISYEFHQKNKRSQLLEGDVLTVQTGAGNGDTCVVPKKYEGSNCHALIVSRTRKEILNPYFLSTFMASDRGKNRIEVISTGGAHPHLNTTELRKEYVPVPALQEQTEIIKVVNSINNSLINKNSKLVQTQSLKKSLMQDLLTGKVRVQVN
jgi:type I restriction enzyme S subunit